MFWGVKIFDSRKMTIQLPSELYITNLCGLGRVWLNRTLIATLTETQPQVSVDYCVNNRVTLLSEGGNVDVCGYCSLDPDRFEMLTKKAQSMQTEVEMQAVYRESLQNIRRMLNK